VTTQPTLVTLIAPAGAGKSTWIAERFTATQRVCLDDYRAKVSDDEGDQGATNEAVAIQGIVVAGRLRRGLVTVLDSTNTIAQIRLDMLNLAGRFNALTVAVVLDTPLETCEDQNDARAAAGGRFVPHEVIAKMHARIVGTIGDGPVPGFRITRRIGPGTDRVFWGPTETDPEHLTVFRDAPWLR